MLKIWHVGFAERRPDSPRQVTSCKIALFQQKPSGMRICDVDSQCERKLKMAKSPNYGGKAKKPIRFLINRLDKARGRMTGKQHEQMRNVIIVYALGKVHYQMLRKCTIFYCEKVKYMPFFLFFLFGFLGHFFCFAFGVTSFHSLGNQAFDPRASSAFFHCVRSTRVWPPRCTGGHICVPLPAQHTRIDGFCLDTAHVKTWKQLPVAFTRSAKVAFVR